MLKSSFKTPPPQEIDRLQPWVEGLAVRLGAPAEGALRFIGIAACSSGDGATTVACATAQRIQQSLGKRVLLVDANLGAPRLHTTFDLPQRPGLTELLSGQHTLREVVHEIEPEGLCVIPAGAPAADCLALFENDAFETMKSRVLEYFDTVIFDCPSLSSDAGTFVIAKKLDGLVMVLAAERTRWENGTRLIEQLRQSRINVLGAVLNRKRQFIPRLIYDHL